MILRFLRFLFLVGVVYALYKWLRKGDGLWPFRTKKKRRDEVPPNTSKGSNIANTPPKIIAEMKKDPICGTYIPENQAVIYEINGSTHYFCSEDCKLKFQELPN